MFNEKLKMGIAGFKVKAKNVKGRIRRTIELTVEGDFVDSIAKKLKAKNTLADLVDMNLEQAKIPISALVVRANFYAPGDGRADQRQVAMRGTTAIANCPSGEGGPTIKMSWLMQFTEEDMVFFGRHLLDEVTIRMSETQLELVTDEDETGEEASEG